MAALAVGFARQPDYTAETRLGIARIDVNAPGALAGFAVASQALAETYSRAVNAEEVTNAVGARVGLPADEVALRVAAVPVPDTPIFRVTAIADTPEQAIELANVSSETLLSYTTNLNRSDPDAERLLDEYQRVKIELDRLARIQGSRTAASKRRKTAESREALVAAAAKTDGARLRVKALEAAYRISRQGGSSTSLFQILSKARTADSDRGPRLQVLLFLAVVLGSAIGVALAVVGTTREVRQAQAP